MGGGNSFGFAVGLLEGNTGGGFIQSLREVSSGIVSEITGG